MEAIVVKHTGSHYLLTVPPGWNLFPAVLRGRIRQKGSTSTNPVAVGDRVLVTLPEMSESCACRDVSCPEDNISRDGVSGIATVESPALITDILPRKNYIIRRSTNLSRQSHIIAANVDMAFIVVTIDFPEVKLPFLDRILVTCEVYGVPATIVLNKSDLSGEEHREGVAAFHNIYEGAGYPVIDVSAVTGAGVGTLRDACKDKVCLFSGVSGVGKSSLIKALDPSLDPRTGEISRSHQQGKHTTTFYEMYPLQGGEK